MSNNNIVRVRCNRNIGRWEIFRQNSEGQWFLADRRDTLMLRKVTFSTEQTYMGCGNHDTVGFAQGELVDGRTLGGKEAKLQFDRSRNCFLSGGVELKKVYGLKLLSGCSSRVIITRPYNRKVVVEAEVNHVEDWNTTEVKQEQHVTVRRV
jgi:hypothetical protein